MFLQAIPPFKERPRSVLSDGNARGISKSGNTRKIKAAVKSSVMARVQGANDV